MRYSEIVKINENIEGEDFNRRSFSSDEYDKAEITDTRKPRLTLRMLNQLKNMRINKSKEMNAKNKIVQKMYGPPEEE